MFFESRIIVRRVGLEVWMGLWLVRDGRVGLNQGVNKGFWQKSVSFSVFARAQRVLVGLTYFLICFHSINRWRI